MAASVMHIATQMEFANMRGLNYVTFEHISLQEEQQVPFMNSIRMILDSQVEIEFSGNGIFIIETQPTEKSSEKHKARWEAMTKAEHEIVRRAIQPIIEKQADSCNLCIEKNMPFILERRFAIAGKMLVENGVFPERIQFDSDECEIRIV